MEKSFDSVDLGWSYRVHIRREFEPNERQHIQQYPTQTHFTILLKFIHYTARDSFLKKNILNRYLEGQATKKYPCLPL